MSEKGRRKCCVATCQQPLGRGAFLVPKDPSVRRQWIDQLGLEVVIDSTRVCFRHFTERDILFTAKKTNYREGMTYISGTLFVKSVDMESFFPSKLHIRITLRIRMKNFTKNFVQLGFLQGDTEVVGQRKMRILAV